MSALEKRGFIHAVVLRRDKVPDFGRYPFAIPAVKRMEELALHPEVTFFVGENGSGKSTLVEAIAMAAGFNAEGGSKNFNFSTRRTESELHQYLRLVRGVKREKTGYFLRAESFYNVASQVDALGLELAAYGDRSLHAQSHGESFLALVNHRFGKNGLYILDEPEAALSPQRQLALLKRIRDLTRLGCQFIIATHSPILLAYPEAMLISLSLTGVETVRYEETEHFWLTRDFLNNRERYLKHLFEE